MCYGARDSLEMVTFLSLPSAGVTTVLPATPVCGAGRGSQNFFHASKHYQMSFQSLMEIAFPVVKDGPMDMFPE